MHSFGEPINEDLCRSSALAALSTLMTRRWTAAVMLALHRGATRFSQIEATVQGISARMLSARLRELELHHLVERVVTPTMPVSVTYTLTDRGRRVLASMQSLAEQDHELEDASEVA